MNLLSLNTLPNTGEAVKNYGAYIGIIIIIAVIFGCILNPGHGKIPAPDFNFYIQKDKYPI